MRSKKLRNFFKKNKNSILLVAFVLVLLSVWFGSSIVEALRLIQLKRDLSTQIVEREEVNSQLDEDIAQIGTQSYIERIARQYLELYYPDEEIVIPVENKLQAETSNENIEKNNDTQKEQPTEEVIDEEAIAQPLDNTEEIIEDNSVDITENQSE